MRYFVRGGFAEVSPAGLTVLAETAIDLVELDAAQFAQAVKDAEEDVADATDDAIRDRAQTKLDHLRQVQATLNLVSPIFTGFVPRPYRVRAPARVAV